MRSILWCWEQCKNQSSDLICGHHRGWGSRHHSAQGNVRASGLGPGSGLGLHELVEGPLLMKSIFLWSINNLFCEPECPKSQVSSRYLPLSSLSKKVQALAEAFPWLRHFLPALPDELTQQPFPSAPWSDVGQGHKKFGRFIFSGGSTSLSNLL